MNEIHPYAIILGFAVGLAAFLGLRIGPIALIVGVIAVVGFNQAFKRARIADERTDQDKLDDDK